MDLGSLYLYVCVYVSYYIVRCMRAATLQDISFIYRTYLITHLRCRTDGPQFLFQYYAFNLSKDTSPSLIIIGDHFIMYLKVKVLMYDLLLNLNAGIVQSETQGAVGEHG